MQNGEAVPGGLTPSDIDPSLPDNAEEAQAATDAMNESLIEKTYTDAVATETAASWWSAIFGK